MVPDHGFDFAKFDTVAVHLYLRVQTAQKFNGAVGVVAGGVAGFVHARVLFSGGKEGSGGLFRIVPVACGESRAKDVEVAGHPVGTVREVSVKDGEGLVRERRSVGNRGPCLIGGAGLMEV